MPTSTKPNPHHLDYAGHEEVVCTRSGGACHEAHTGKCQHHCHFRRHYLNTKPAHAEERVEVAN